MNEKLLANYRKYASTEEAHAVVFVRMHLAQSKGHWVDAVDYCRYERSNNPLHFRYVFGGLYKRRIHPVYPPESAFTLNGRFDEQSYALLVRAITWQTAHKDIEQQRAAKVRPLRFKITGVSYDRNRGKENFFSDDAPPEIKALANNLSDRTNPLWDKAMQYVTEPEYVYEIRTAKVITRAT